MTITDSPLATLNPAFEDPIRWTSPVLAPLANRLRARIQITEIGILTVATLVGYTWVAWWMRERLHFFINDALARTSDAVFVTIGRDPHLGAIGFYWPPLPQLIQAPFVPVLAPFGHADLAGPFASALCTALTVPVLSRLGIRLGLSTGVRFGICLLFAVNPITIFYAGNGMSEACSVLFISIAMLGFLNFTRTRSTSDLTILAVGLSGAVMTRLETPLLVVVLAVAAAFEPQDWRNWRKQTWTAALVALPPAVTFAFWMGVQWVLLGSPFFYRHQAAKGIRNVPGWAPNPDGHPWVALTWAFHWVLVLGPAVILAALLVLWSPLRKDTRGTVGIVAGAAVFPVTQVNLLIHHVGYANPRYFMTAVLFATLAVAWLASTESDFLGRLWNAALIGVLVVGSVTGSRTLSGAWTTHIEGECRFILAGPAKVLQFLAVRYQPGSINYCGRGEDLNDGLASWRKLDRYVDSHLKPTDRVLADNFSNFYAVLWTKRPNQFVVRNDRDWQRIAANPVGHVTYIVTTENVGTGGYDELPHGDTDVGFQIVSANISDWKLVASFPGGTNVAMATATPELFKYVGPAPQA